MVDAENIYDRCHSPVIVQAQAAGADGLLPIKPQEEQPSNVTKDSDAVAALLEGNAEAEHTHLSDGPVTLACSQRQENTTDPPCGAAASCRTQMLDRSDDNLSTFPPRHTEPQLHHGLPSATSPQRTVQLDSELPSPTETHQQPSGPQPEAESKGALAQQHPVSRDISTGISMVPPPPAGEQPLQSHVEITGAASVTTFGFHTAETIPEKNIEEEIEGADANDGDDDNLADTAMLGPLSDHCTMDQANLAAELPDLAPAQWLVPPTTGAHPKSEAPTQVQN